jgi:hypothetical protein
MTEAAFCLFLVNVLAFSSYTVAKAANLHKKGLALRGCASLGYIQTLSL